MNFDLAVNCDGGIGGKFLEEQRDADMYLHNIIDWCCKQA